MKPPCIEMRLSPNWCSRALYEQQIEGRLTLPPEWWQGWRIVKDWIKGPGGIQFHRRQLEALWRLGRMKERAAERKNATAYAPTNKAHPARIPAIDLAYRQARRQQTPVGRTPQNRARTT